VQLHAQAAHGVIGFLRVLVESIAGGKASFFHPGDQPMKVVCESKQRLVHFPCLLRRQVIAVHQPPDLYICTIDGKMSTGFLSEFIRFPRKEAEFDPQDAAVWSNLADV